MPKYTTNYKNMRNCPFAFLLVKTRWGSTINTNKMWVHFAALDNDDGQNTKKTGHGVPPLESKLWLFNHSWSKYVWLPDRHNNKYDKQNWPYLIDKMKR